MASDWPLLTGGRYSEVVDKTGLTVVKKHICFGKGHKEVSRAASYHQKFIDN
jgi:hypothetical protein